jgi:hypothetical protein
VDFRDFLTEATTASRYSVDVNFRTTMKEVDTAAAKIMLGYVSAALKQNGFHVKQLYEEPPIRIIISGRNFEIGEWVSLLIFYPDKGGRFVIAQGFYTNQRTVAIQSHRDSKSESPNSLAAEMRNVMNELRSKPDRYQQKLKPVPLKRGPRF